MNIIRYGNVGIYVCMYLSIYVSMHNVLLAFHNFYLLFLCFYVCLGYFSMCLSQLKLWVIFVK